jgi:hypothetical protein
VGRANEFGGATKLGACSRRRDLCLGLTAPNQCPRKGLNTRAGFDRHGFAGEHRLVDQNFTGGELHIGRNHAAKRELHQIARRQVRCGHRFPHAVALDRGGKCEARLQRG